MYKNLCPHCLKCKSIRIPTSTFTLSKSQRKIWKINQDIEVRLCQDKKEMLSDEKIRLYADYSKKHDKTMTKENSLEELIYWNGIDSETGLVNYKGTRNLDYYLDGKLIAVSVIDIVNDGISSVYFYYDLSSPCMKRSLGSYSVLYEIDLCRSKGLDYYYLGYYIEDCNKMNYKAHFKPFQILSEKGAWKDQIDSVM